MKKSPYSNALSTSSEAESFDIEARASGLPDEQPDVLRCPPDLQTALADNMAVGNLQTQTRNEEGEVSNYKGGIDTLHLSLSVEWCERFEPETLPLLRRCQTASKSGDEGGQYFRIGDQVFHVFANGAGRGKGVFRHFIVEGSGIHFEFSTCSAPGDDYFNAVVVIGSLTCNSVSLEKLWQRINLFFSCLGGRILASRVSRVDPYVDAAGIPLRWAMKAWSEDRVICRARSFSVHGDRKDAQTLKIGAGTFIRIYNKIAELQAKPDARKAEQISGKFGGQLPDVLTRFEFQCNRRFLRDFKIHSMQDLLSNLNSLGSYLSRAWFRITEHKVDRNHTERFATSKTWNEIAATFERLGQDAITNLVRVRQTCRNAPALIRQALGCMLKAVHGDCMSVAGFLKETYERMREDIVDMGNDKFYAKLAQCHAKGQTAQIDKALSGPPKFVCANDVLKRLNEFFRKHRDQDKTPSQSLFDSGTTQSYVGEGWPEAEFETEPPEEFIF